MSELPVGRRFSENYLIPAELLQDSKRMRRRVAASVFRHAGNIRSQLNSEIGTALPGAVSGTTDYWPHHFAQLELRDVLDAITVAARQLADSNRSSFLADIARIFDEEQTSYVVDSHGGVHFRVDAEFERTRTSAIGSLASSRYDGVRDQFERAQRALDSIPPDGKLAIRCAFYALEGLFRLIFSNAHQLSGAEVLKHLKPLIDRSLAAEKPALQVASKQLEALRDWIDGAHFYRHEPGTEEPNQPPLELAVMMASQAGAYLRWLRHFDGGR